MDIFITIVLQLLSLFVVILLGFIARKKLCADKDTIAKILFYIISPIVFFTSIARMEFHFSILFLPFLIFILASSLCLGTYYLSKKYFPSLANYANIISFSSCNSNVGYFLLPIVWAIFDEKTIAIFVTMVIGNNIYENTTGFFIASRGQYSVKEALKKIIKLPSIYAFLFGLLFSYCNYLFVPHMFDDFIHNMRGSYTILGMMIIGLALADIESFLPDYKFIAASFSIKFILWPLFAIIFIFLDKYLFNIFEHEVYKALFLFSCAPIGANNIVIASILGENTQKIAFAVVVSTIFAVLWIGLVVSFVLPHI